MSISPLYEDMEQGEDCLVLEDLGLLAEELLCDEVGAGGLEEDEAGGRVLGDPLLAQQELGTLASPNATCCDTNRAKFKFKEEEFMDRLREGLRLYLAMPANEAIRRLLDITRSRELKIIKGMSAQRLVIEGLAILGGYNAKAMDTKHARDVLGKFVTVLGQKPMKQPSGLSKLILHAVLEAYIPGLVQANAGRRPASLTDLMCAHVNKLGARWHIETKENLGLNVRGFFDKVRDLCVRGFLSPLAMDRTTPCACRWLGGAP